MENTSSGNEVIVADIDTFGRCVVLICQDFMSKPFSNDVIFDFQPDWVIVPIFDSSIKDGGWCHQRAFSLSSISQARFIIANNTAFLDSDENDKLCGLAIGPMNGQNNELNRAVKFIKTSAIAGYEVSKFEWGDDSWDQSTLTGKH